MSNVKHLPKSLPKEDFVFDVSIEGALTKQKYEGSFEFKIPNLRMQAQIAKYKAYLNGTFSDSLDQGTKNLHHMTAYCKICLSDSPQWFVDSDWGMDLYDLNVLEEVYAQILKLEQAWLESIWGKSEDFTEPEENKDQKRSGKSSGKK